MNQKLIGNILGYFFDTMAYDAEKAQYGHPGSVVTPFRLITELKCTHGDLAIALPAIDRWADANNMPSPVAMCRIPAGFSRDVAPFDFYTWARREGKIPLTSTRESAIIDVSVFGSDRIQLFGELITFDELAKNKTMLERDLCMEAYKHLYLGR